MAFAIIFHDDPDRSEIRLCVREAHVAYIRANLYRVVASGGLLTDDGASGIGGLIILDTNERSDAEEFVRIDPFFAAGLFTRFTITRWRKAFVAGEDLLDREERPPARR